MYYDRVLSKNILNDFSFIVLCFVGKFKSDVDNRNNTYDYLKFQNNYSGNNHNKCFENCTDRRILVSSKR